MHKAQRASSVPFNRSYWVVPGRFLAGAYPGSEAKELAYQKLKGLLDCGIRRIINLMEADEKNWGGKPFVSYEDQITSIAASTGETVDFERMPIKDTSIPSRIAMTQILDCIDQSNEEAKPVYVHCWGGRGRTGTVVGCYLARHGFGSDSDILKVIRELRKGTEDDDEPSPETSQQTDMVLSWCKGE